MQNYDVIIVDFNNFFFRTCFYPWKEEEPITDESRQQNYATFLASLNNLCEAFGHPKIVFLSDFPVNPDLPKMSSSSHRREIFADYKKNRTQKRKEIVEDMEHTIMLLKQSSENIHLIAVPGYEADDLVDDLIKLFKDKKILLVTNDKDWSVNLKQGQVDIFNESLKMLSPLMTDDFFLTEEKFITKEGYKPNPGIILYKSIRGDSGDNIPKGVLRMPEEIVKHCAKMYETVDEMIEKSEQDEVIPEKWKQRIKESSDQLRLNSRLVSKIHLPEGTNLTEYTVSAEG